MKPPPKFIADAMLGSLARKLRIFGYDTLYFNEGRDQTLEALARKGSRVILTSDTLLFKHSQASGLPAILVKGVTDRARLLSVQAQSGSGLTFSISRGLPTRCAACNGELETFRKRDVGGKVPPRVLARHRLFFRCASCSRLYWRGKHWGRLRRLSYSLTASARAPRRAP